MWIEYMWMSLRLIDSLKCLSCHSKQSKKTAQELNYQHSYFFNIFASWQIVLSHNSGTTRMFMNFVGSIEIKRNFIYIQKVYGNWNDSDKECVSFAKLLIQIHVNIVNKSIEWVVLFNYNYTYIRPVQKKTHGHLTDQFRFYPNTTSIYTILHDKILMFLFYFINILVWEERKRRDQIETSIRFD